MSFALSVATVFPIFFYLMVGIGMRRLRRISDHTLSQMNRITFSFFFPFVMFNNIYKTHIDDVLNLRFLLTMVGLVLALSPLTPASSGGWLPPSTPRRWGRPRGYRVWRLRLAASFPSLNSTPSTGRVGPAS